jgi:MFS family permease
MCAVKGLGLGYVSTLSAGGIITRSFEGRERDKYMGWQAAAKYIGGTAMTTVAGYIAAVSWNNVFLVNLLAVPVFILVAVLMPSDKVLYPETVKAEADPKSKEKIKLHPSVYITAVLSFCLMLFNVITSNLAMRMVSVGGTAVHSGWASSAYTLTSLFVSFFFVYISKSFKRCTFPVGMLIYAIGACGLGFFTNSIPAVFVFVMISGVGMAIFSVATNVEGTLFVKGVSRVMAISVLSSAVGLAMFAAPIVTGAASTMLYGATEAINRYQTASLILIPASILLIIRGAILQKSNKSFLLESKHKADPMPRENTLH